MSDNWPAMSLDQVRAVLTAPGMPFEMETIEVAGRPLRTFVQAPRTLRETFLAGRGFGAREYLVHEDERVTFEAFARATLALAARLQADGVTKGDRVAVAMRNLPEWPVAFFAATLVGAIAVPLNAWWTTDELGHGLYDSGASILIADAERLARLPDRTGLPALKTVYVARGAAPGAVPLESVIGAPGSWAGLPEGTLPQVALDPEDDATLFYTSGTSGRPKGALGTHRNNGINPHALGWSQASAALRRGEAPVDPATVPPKVLLVSIPFFHTTGCQTVMVSALATGAKLVLMRRFEPGPALALIAAERVTSTGGVPTIAWQLLEHPDFGTTDLSSLESVAYGGAPAAPELVSRLRAGVPGSLPGTGWGMTETSATVTHFTGEDYVRRPNSCGPAIPVCDLKITDADGRTLPPGEIGELWAQGPNVVKAYWNQPEATARTFVDGWVRTGDIATLDAEGFCTIVDRAKDMIIRGGENIYCIEVENALFAHPAIMDAAVVGLPDQVLGEVPAAVVALAPGESADEAALRAHCATRLAGFKVPARILFHEGLLPRNANGKILKAAVKALFTEQRAAATASA